MREPIGERQLTGMQEMKRTSWIFRGALAIVLVSCSGKGRDDDDAASLSTSITNGNETDPGVTSGVSDESDGGEKFDVEGGTQTGCDTVDIGCTDQIDLLFVIDNSGTMADAQENLARNFPLLIRQLEELTDANDELVYPDVQIMVTTTDMDNPLCSQWHADDYEPAKGSPITTPCTDRLPRFTGLPTLWPGAVSKPEVCTNRCINDVAPIGDPFIWFHGDNNNLPDVPPTDITGDGEPNSPVAQALSCIGPQGFDGCGFEKQLESMLQALNPNASWNTAERPFLRPGALLAIVIVSDEVDCSVKDFSVMSDPDYQNVNPNSGMKSPSSALCWNAGVDCTGPDANGVYSQCTSNTTNEKLQPLTRYTDYLIKQLRENEKKEVVMLGIWGVPEVTAYNPQPPYEPVEGGVLDLEYRDWRASDIYQEQADANITAQYMQYDLGIGPGCMFEGSPDIPAIQAAPPVRMRQVCEALNIERQDGSVDIRCCIESICSEDFSNGIRCLTGAISKSIVLPG
jgi:hypothetical protein